MKVEMRKCPCGNTIISLAKFESDKLWHGICLACGVYALKGSTTKTGAKELWNDSFVEDNNDSKN